MPRSSKVAKVLALAKGFAGRSKNCYRIAKPRVERALRHAYVERRLRKRGFRKEWIQQINAAVRLHGVKYGNFINSLNKSSISLDRKMLANLCTTEPLSFASILRHVIDDMGCAVTEANRRDEVDFGLVASTWKDSIEFQEKQSNP